MNNLSLNQKAVKNLADKGINAKIEHGNVYVEIDEVLLEISKFEIEFQADEFCKNQELTQEQENNLREAAKKMVDHQHSGKFSKSFFNKMRNKYTLEFGYSRLNDALDQAVQNRYKIDLIPAE
jgi:hypothetical protein